MVHGIEHANAADSKCIIAVVTELKSLSGFAASVTSSRVKKTQHKPRRDRTRIKQQCWDLTPTLNQEDIGIILPVQELSKHCTKVNIRKHNKRNHTRRLRATGESMIRSVPSLLQEMRFEKAIETLEAARANMQKAGDHGQMLEVQSLVFRVQGDWLSAQMLEQLRKFPAVDYARVQKLAGMAGECYGFYRRSPHATELREKASNAFAVGYDAAKKERAEDARRFETIVENSGDNLTRTARQDGMDSLDKLRLALKGIVAVGRS
jgi:hypothetical protein